MLAESETPTRPALELGNRDPASVLTGDGLLFGDPGPEALLASQGFESDPLVQSAATRGVYSADTLESVATVSALGLAPGVFTSAAAVDGYVRGLAVGVAGGDDTPVDAQLGALDGFAASSESRSVITFRLDNVVVLVAASSPAGARIVAAAMVNATVGGAVADPGTTTPFAVLDPAAAFVALNGFVFAPFPTDEEKVVLAFEPLPVPLIDGMGGLPQGRLVVLGNEIRASAWALPASPDSYASAEALVDPMRLLAAARSGGEVSEQVVAGRTIYKGDASEPIRVFRLANLVLVVDGLDAANADAVVAEWARSLDPN